MTVTLIGERRQGSGGYSYSGSRIHTTAKYHYQVLASSTSVTRAEVLLTPGLPAVGRDVEPQLGGVCVNVTADRNTVNTLYWDVTADFSTDDGGHTYDPGYPSPDPSTWLPVWKIEYDQDEFYFPADRNGTKACNSANCRFDEPISKPMLVASWSFSQYFPDTLSEKDVQEYHGIMNKTTFQGFTQDTLALLVVGSERGIYNGYPCRRVDFKAKYKEGIPAGSYKYFEADTSTWEDATWTSGWQELRLDVGPFYLDSSAQKTYFTDDGTRIIGQLDGAGGRRSATSTPLILAFDVYKEYDFNLFLKKADDT